MEFNSLEDFRKEFDRLWMWRDWWARLANRNNRSDAQDKRSANARFLASLQKRDERVQARAWLKNLQINDLMEKCDKWRESQKPPCNHKKRKLIDFNEETYVGTFLCPCGHKWTSKAKFVCG